MVNAAFLPLAIFLVRASSTEPAPVSVSCLTVSAPCSTLSSTRIPRRVGRCSTVPQA